MDKEPDAANYVVHNDEEDFHLKELHQTISGGGLANGSVSNSSVKSEYINTLVKNSSNPIIQVVKQFIQVNVTEESFNERQSVRENPGLEFRRICLLELHNNEDPSEFE